MSQYEAVLADKIVFLSDDQQKRVLEFVENIEANEPLNKLIIRLKFDPFEIRCFAKYQDKSFSYGTSSSDDDIVQILSRYVREHHHLLIGRPTAEKAIDEIGSLYLLAPERTHIIKGRDLDTGLPASREISSIEVREQIAPPIRNQINQFKANFGYLLRQMELPEHVLGGATIRLRGRYGYVRGSPERLQEITGLKVIVEQ